MVQSGVSNLEGRAEVVDVHVKVGVLFDAVLLPKSASRVDPTVGGKASKDPLLTST